MTPQPLKSPGAVAANLALDQIQQPATLARLVVVPHALVEPNTQRTTVAVPELATSRHSVVGLAEQIEHGGLGDGSIADVGHGTAPRKARDECATRRDQNEGRMTIVI